MLLAVQDSMVALMRRGGIRGPRPLVSAAIMRGFTHSRSASELLIVVTLVGNTYHGHSARAL